MRVAGAVMDLFNVVVPYAGLCTIACAEGRKKGLSYIFPFLFREESSASIKANSKPNGYICIFKSKTYHIRTELWHSLFQVTSCGVFFPPNLTN